MPSTMAFGDASTEGCVDAHDASAPARQTQLKPLAVIAGEMCARIGNFVSWFLSRDQRRTSPTAPQASRVWSRTSVARRSGREKKLVHWRASQEQTAGRPRSRLV